MADTDGLTATTAAPETTVEASPPPAESASKAVAAEPTKPDPYALLAEVDVDELIRRDPRLQGKIGSAAQRQAMQEVQRLTRERQAEEESRMEQARREELRQLARNDPDKLAQETLRDLRSQEQKAREAQLWQQFQRETGGQLEQQFNSFYQRPIVQELWKQTDDTTRAKLDWRNYDSVGEWAEAAADVIAEYRSDSKAEAKAKKLVEAASKSDRVEAMAGEASEGVDLGLGGMVEGGRRFKRSEINPHGPNFMGREAWKKHAAAIEYQMDNGLLIED